MSSHSVVMKRLIAHDAIYMHAINYGWSWITGMFKSSNLIN